VRRIDEEHMAVAFDGGIKGRLQLCVEEFLLGGERARSATFWGHGHGPDALPSEADAGQKGAGLRQTATDAGEQFNAVAGFGGGPDRQRG